MSDQGHPVFTDDMTLGEARTLLRQYVNDGYKCPCCTQFAKVYRRTINSGMAISLLTMWRAAGADWQHVPTTVGGKSREEGKLAYWGLVEPQTSDEDEPQRGWWRVTRKGIAWLAGRITVEKYANVYDGRCLRLHGEPITLRQALGKKFDYEELMADVKFPDWYGQGTVFGEDGTGVGS
jgi:hypothetical protein